MLTTKRGYRKPSFKIDKTEIRLADNIRYLVVQLSSVLGFKKHIEVASYKAMRSSSALGRIMSNVGGTATDKRKLLTTAVH